MSTQVTLPELGESVTEGTVSRWLKQVGDSVAVDEPLLEISTDKVDTEIPSPAAGTLLEISASEDETVQVGSVLAMIGEPSEAGGGGQPSEPESGQQPQEQQSGQQALAQQQPQGQQATQQQAPAEQTAPQPAGSSTQSTQQPAAQQPAQSSAGDGSGGAATGTEVKLPELGESVTEGTVSRWLKQVGDSVAVDEPLLEISTDKVDTEVPSPTAGTLLQTKASEDDTVEVGSVLAIIGEPSQQQSGQAQPAQPAAQGQEQQQQQQQATSQQAPAPQAAQQAAPAPQAAQQAAPAPQAAQQAAPVPQAGRQTQQPAQQPAPAPEQQTQPQPAQAGSGGQTQQDQSTAGGQSPTAGEQPGYVTPLVRKLAAEHNVDLSTVQGSGVGGRIRKQDVLSAAEAAKSQQAQQPAAATGAAPSAAPSAPQPSSLRGTTEKMSRLRKIIANRMVESLQNSAQLTTVVEADITAISRLRDRVKADFANREGVKLSYLPFMIRTAVEALKVHPKLNATIDTEAEEIHYPATENISMAVDTDQGLVVPVIKQAGDLSIAGLAKSIADLADRTRNNKLSPNDVSGGTFTITNTGSRGALIDTPIVNQPQVAILGTGALVKRPVVLTDDTLGETIAIRDMMYLSLSYDHRLVDGADAARFLATCKQRLEEADFGSEFGI